MTLPLKSIPASAQLCDFFVLVLRSPAALFKHPRADVVQRLVQPGAVIERQPVNHLIHGLSARGKRLAMQSCDLQMPPQALGRCAIPAVPLAAHRALHAVLFQSALKFMPAVLATPV